MNLSSIARRALVLAAGAVLSFGSLADSYPSKPVSLVVPYPAGGASDFVARTIQPQLSRLLGQPVVVENIGGAGGAIGVQKVVSGASDGHVVLMGTPMELMLAPLAMSSVKYKPDDLKLVGRVGVTSMLLAVRKDLPVSSIDELIAYVKRPGARELSYGSVGPGSLYHLVGEKFSQVLGVRMIHVPYKGMAPLTTDLMGGQIDIVFMPFAGPVPAMVQDGKVKALGLTTRTPHPQFPSLALLSNHLALPEFEFDVWSGLQVHKNTPADVVERLNKALYDTLQLPEVRKSLEGTGSQVAPRMTPAELARVYAGETARYQAISRLINLQPQ